MSDQGLLPCPFCGGEAEIVSTRKGQSWVLCDNGKCFAQGPKHASESRAIAAWNTRTPPTTGDNPVPISNIKDKTDA